MNGGLIASIWLPWAVLCLDLVKGVLQVTPRWEGVDTWYPQAQLKGLHLLPLGLWPDQDRLVRLKAPIIKGLWQAHQGSLQRLRVGRAHSHHVHRGTACRTVCRPAVCDSPQHTAQGCMNHLQCIQWRHLTRLKIITWHFILSYFFYCKEK